jgi:hypothetical protein
MIFRQIKAFLKNYYNSRKHPEHDFLYVESKRARVEREKKRKFQEQFEFTKQDLALATVPGMEFDPRNRCFAPDELKPQPIIRKRKKVLFYFLL